MNIERFDQNSFMKAKSAIRGVLFELFVLFTCFKKLSHIIELVRFRSGVFKKDESIYQRILVLGWTVANISISPDSNITTSI